MIISEMEDFLSLHRSTFVKSAKNIAILMSDHNVAHAKLLLSQYKYSKVPVIDKEKHFIGVIGLNEIIEFEMSTDFYEEKSHQTKISEIVNSNFKSVQEDFKIEEILNKLVKDPFIPVLRGEIFTGIITRQEVLKAVNAMIHSFTKDYDIRKRNT
ncbi:MAG: cyclic-di-AMP-binding protein CbpB [Lactovum sp.]